MVDFVKLVETYEFVDEVLSRDVAFVENDTVHFFSFQVAEGSESMRAVAPQETVYRVALSEK